MINDTSYIFAPHNLRDTFEKDMISGARHVMVVIELFAVKLGRVFGRRFEKGMGSLRNVGKVRN